MVKWIVLGLILAPSVLFIVMMIAVALSAMRPRRAAASFSRPKSPPEPPPRNRPAASAAPPAPTPTGDEPNSSPETTAWLDAYRRAHPNATHEMVMSAVRERRDDQTKYRGMSPGMKSAFKEIERQRRGTGWDGDWAR
ncbi:hypothetical protein ACFVT2_43080 [Streptomyces sp. NPDC058000]|uniref:hypothetical protein n=1 Tax=Streptomyces sp. NPDC058000 TaxID=3346299 RepID=UPI0036EACA68